METNVVIGTGDNIGKIGLNINRWSVLEQLLDSFWSVFIAGGRRKILVLIMVIIILSILFRNKRNRR